MILGSIYVLSLLARGAAYQKKKKKEEKKSPSSIRAPLSLSRGGRDDIDRSFSFLENEREKIAFNIAFDLIVYGAIIFPKQR